MELHPACSPVRRFAPTAGASRGLPQTAATPANPVVLSRKAQETPSFPPSFRCLFAPPYQSFSTSVRPCRPESLSDSVDRNRWLRQCELDASPLHIRPPRLKLRE